MEINITDEKYFPDVMEIVKLFEPFPDDVDAQLNINYSINCENEENSVINVSYKLLDKVTEQSNSYSNKLYNFRTLLKIAVYDCLSSHYQKQLPWGALTGIRPTKLCYDMLKQGENWPALPRLLNERYRVSKEKANLAVEVIFNQKNLEIADNLVDLYINIPFCTTRCSYCSFISAEIDKVKEFITPYVDSLIKEIQATLQIIYENYYWVKSIYIGGGTPTSLPPEQLDRLLDSIVLPNKVNEFTVDAGRPDTITAEKLEILKKHGVTRISVNPQSFNDEVLKRIGRNHTAMETLEKYRLARKYDFDINMDLIAGLPKETLKSFKENVNIALTLEPENITIHSLSLKRASEFAQKNVDIFKKSLAEKMIDYAHGEIIKSGYKPYYLYRQKNQAGNLENVGYYKDDKKCIFNIDSMEEHASILACGANAISKRVFLKENRIEREANVKDIPSYINRIDEMIERKKSLFKKI